MRGFVETRHRKLLVRSMLLLGDTLGLGSATLLATELRFGRLAATAAFEVAQNAVTYDEVGWLVVLLGIFFLLRAGLYDIDSLFWGSAEFTRVAHALVNTTAAFLLASYALKMPGLSRAWVLLNLVLGVLFVSGARLLMRLVLRTVRRNGWFRRRTLIVGCNDEADYAARFLLNRPETGLVPIGYLAEDDEDSSPAPADLENLGAECDLPIVVRSRAVDSVLIASSAYDNVIAQRLVALLRGIDVSIYLTSVYREILPERVSLLDMAGTHLIRIRPVTLAPREVATKRFIDVFASLAGIIVGLPIWTLIAVAIKVDSPGPVLFRQERVGKGGKRFEMLKFRSMCETAEEMLSDLQAHNESTGPLFKMSKDPRVTRVGRWLRSYSIDEFPQLVNVLRGEMSLVGPRPPLPSEVDQYTETEWRRLDVRPGMTGLWQVSGRSALSFEEMVWMDLFYIENWSVGLDASLIARTAGAVLAARGAW